MLHSQISLGLCIDTPPINLDQPPVNEFREESTFLSRTTTLSFMISHERTNVCQYGDKVRQVYQVGYFFPKLSLFRETSVPEA